MVSGSKLQSLSLNLDDFVIYQDADKLLLTEQAKFLGLWVRNELRWGNHIFSIVLKMPYYVQMHVSSSKENHPITITTQYLQVLLTIYDRLWTICMGLYNRS